MISRGWQKRKDVAIEFTLPGAVSANIEALAAQGVPVVVGTTGWISQMDQVRAAVERHKTGLVWSPNFSIGVNASICRVVREAARLLENEPQYGAWAWEIHHHTKKDAPSGTFLLKLVEEMKNAYTATRMRLTRPRTGPARIQARTKLGLTQRRIRLRSGTLPAAGKASPEAH